MSDMKKPRETAKIIGHLSKQQTWSHRHGFERKLFLNDSLVQNFFEPFNGKTVRITVEVINDDLK